MGAHANYYRIIHYLILLKGEFKRLPKNKYQDLIIELSKYDITPHSENKHIPNHNKDLAKILNYPQTRVNSLSKSLLNDLICNLILPPLIVKNHVHQIHIHLPYNEHQKLTKERKEEEREESTCIEMELPITPRVGEEILLPFVEETGMNYRGYVHGVSHRINGTTQEIHIEVHPFHHYYYKWMKLKDDYEDRERWLRSMENR